MMNRRDFVKNAALGSSALLIPLPHFAKTSKYKMGLQLFTVNEYMLKNPQQTLAHVKALGYEDFEIFGFEPIKNTFYGIPSTEFKSLLDDMNLTASSGHFGFSSYLDKSIEELKTFVDQCIVGAKDLDLSYITWPWIAPEQRTRDNFKKMATRLNLIGEQVNAAGLGFAYHNHGYEFEDYGGETGYDIILQDTDADLVKLQMDMYWVMHSANFTPKELVADQPGRVVMWHIKDMHKTSRDYTELGNGSIDYTKILPDPEQSGLEYYYIEQGGNFAENALKSVETSAIYFKKNLKKYL